MKNLLLLLIIPFLSFSQDCELVSDIIIEAYGCAANTVIEIIPADYENTTVFWDTIGGWTTFTDSSIVLNSTHLGNHFVSVSNDTCSEDLIINVPQGYTDECGNCDAIVENDCIGIFEFLICVYEDLNCNNINDFGEGGANQSSGFWETDTDSGYWSTDTGSCSTILMPVPFDFSNGNIIISQNVNEELYIPYDNIISDTIQIDTNSMAYELTFFNCPNPCYNDLDFDEIDWLNPNLSSMQINWQMFNWGFYWDDLNLHSLVDWSYIPWNNIIELNIYPEDFIYYITIQNISCENPFNWNSFISFFENNNYNEFKKVRKLITIVDVLGRNISKENKDTLLLFIYDDGSIEKKYVIE
tara:strand:- start:6 stop:1073 length:1068 start_codon:yes stop_codon:yes gene_type:complete